MIFEFISNSPNAMAGLSVGQPVASVQDLIGQASRWTHNLLPTCSMVMESVFVENNDSEEEGPTDSYKFSVDVVQESESGVQPIGALLGAVDGGRIVEVSMSAQSNPLPDLRLTSRLVAREIKEISSRLQGRSVVLNQADSWVESHTGTLSQPAVLADITVVREDGSGVSKSFEDVGSHNSAVVELMRGAPAGAHVWNVVVGVMVDENEVLRLFGLARLRVV